MILRNIKNYQLIKKIKSYFKTFLEYSTVITAELMRNLHFPERHIVFIKVFFKYFHIDHYLDLKMSIFDIGI